MKKSGRHCLLILSSFFMVCCCDKPQQRDFIYRVGILGAPSKPDVEWNDRNIRLMKELGFNTLQLNIAWGYRPGDDPLNLEDVLPVPEKYRLPVDTDSTLNRNVGSSKTFIRSQRAVAARAADLKKRITLCREHGMRSIFHFGAPFVEYPAFEPLSQCISDPVTTERYVTLIRNFHKEFPGVDDLLLYTYDQNAWLCSEDGECEKCKGVPLHKRVSTFVNTLARTWHGLNPDGKLWWEPWEISAGQTFMAIDLLDKICVGLSIHSSIAEVQLALTADRWFKNILSLAAEKGIPVIGEMWLGCATEELEPYVSIPTPLATLRALRAMNQAGELSGLKEYFGNLPDREDPNLRMTSIFFGDPSVSEEKALNSLARPYGNASEQIKDYWRYVSQAVEMYPWDVSWLAREAGRSEPDHLLTAATLKGVGWETPSWASNRRAAFMRTAETDYPHFWMLEDVQLRFELAASKIDQALDAASKCRRDIPEGLLQEFDNGVNELTEFRRRILSYVYHIRETNLCNIMRSSLARGWDIKQENISELRSVLQKDLQNQQMNNNDLKNAIDLLDKDLRNFLDTYFLETDISGGKAFWTITSK